MPFPKGKSGNPAGRPKKTRTDTAERERRFDGWSSLINGLGNSDYDKRMSVGFGNVSPVDDATAANLWRGNALAKKIIEKLPKHEMRAGFEVEIKDDDTAEGGDEDGSEDEEDDEVRSDALARMYLQDVDTGERRPMYADALAIPEGKPDPKVVEAKKLGAEKRLGKERGARDAADTSRA